MRNLFTILFWLLLSVAPVFAADFQKGWEAYQRGDFATALQKWRPLAEQGDGRAQFNLGIMYDRGNGVAEDDKQAVYWYRKAAEQGHAWAQSNLGLMYLKGEGVAEDYILAYKWANLAAAQGYKNAANMKKQLRKRMTRAQIAEAQRLSREWSPKQYGE